MLRLFRNFIIFVLSWSVTVFLIPKYSELQSSIAYEFIFDNVDVVTVGALTVLSAIGLNIYIFQDCIKQAKTFSKGIKIANVILNILVATAVLVSLLFLYIIKMYYYGIGF